MKSVDNTTVVGQWDKSMVLNPSRTEEPKRGTSVSDVDHEHHLSADSTSRSGPVLFTLLPSGRCFCHLQTPDQLLSTCQEKN